MAVKVLVVSNGLSGGGAERFAANLLRGLADGRIELRAAVLHSPSPETLADAVPVHDLNYRGAVDFPRATWRLRSLLRAWRPHVVLGGGSAVNVVIGVALAMLRHRPAWIARVDTFRSQLWFRQRVLGLLYPLAHAVVANSAGLRAALAAAYPGQKKKMISIHNPVNAEMMDRLALQRPSWAPTQPLPIVISLGHATSAKRWDVVLRAFARMVRHTPAQLVLCGDGPLLGRHRKLARHLNIAPWVHFTGHCANPFPLLAQADLFVLSSEAEGLPNALIEAQAMGLAAVATRCAFGPEEIIEHGVTGLLVSVQDPAAMAAAMGCLLSDRQMRLAMGQAAAVHTRRRFAMDTLCARWKELIVAQR